MPNRKKRILFISEAAYLNTGYAKYSKEVISRIHKTGKYDIAEFSIYGNHKDARIKEIPWKAYANMPDVNNEEETKLYSSNVSNQFGAWRFERVCLDFEPDIVFTIRDFWMDSFVYHSPYRRIFSWAWMPTVDASPQNQEWIDMFGNADYILTYSYWAKTLLEKQGGSNINTVGVASPSAAECFVPMNKEKIRAEFGLRNDINIVGTVMRNQRRKLFPALLESFGRYLKESKSTNTFLYLHTSFPDAGWNLAQLMHDNEISSRVIMTYVCENCKAIEPSFFRDVKKVCNKCGLYASTPSNVGNGVSDENLAKIYNLFDLYIQLANSEGFGLPQVEAAACGIPIACTNYSAMEDVVKKLGAYGIHYTTYKELETGCNRAVPDTQDIVNLLNIFFSKDKEEILEAGKNTRLLFEKNYSWDKTAEEWMKIADSCSYSDWKQPANFIPPKEIDTKKLSNYGFIRDATNLLFNEDHKNSHFMRSMMTDIIRGMSKTTYDGYYVSEFSPFANHKPRAIDRDTIVKILQGRLQNYNIWEQVRVDRSSLKEGDSEWLK